MNSSMNSVLSSISGSGYYCQQIPWKDQNQQYGFLSVLCNFPSLSVTLTTLVPMGPIGHYWRCKSLKTGLKHRGVSNILNQGGLNIRNTVLGRYT